jgi:hypothetical protein
MLAMSRSKELLGPCAAPCALYLCARLRDGLVLRQSADTFRNRLLVNKSLGHVALRAASPSPPETKVYKRVSRMKTKSRKGCTLPPKRQRS